MSNVFYKVVQGSNLKSARRFSNPVTYKIGEWVNGPNDSRLFVFEKLRDAQRFAYLPDEVVYECEIKGRVRMRGAAVDSQISVFWKLFNQTIKNKKKLTESDFTKKGIKLATYKAVLAKQVKLLKLVDS